MKDMKKYIQYLAVSLVAGSTITACTKSFLTVTPVGTNLEANYYQTQAQAFAGLVSVYDVVGWQGGGFVTKENAMDAASDDHVAGLAGNAEHGIEERHQIVDASHDVSRGVIARLASGWIVVDRDRLTV